MQVTTQAGKTVQQVKEYDLFLDIDFTGLKFTGKVSIDLESSGDVSLDAVGLQVLNVKSATRPIPFKQVEHAHRIRKKGGCQEDSHFPEDAENVHLPPLPRRRKVRRRPKQPR